MYIVKADAALLMNVTPYDTTDLFLGERKYSKLWFGLTNKEKLLLYSHKMGKGLTSSTLIHLSWFSFNLIISVATNSFVLWNE